MHFNNNKKKNTNNFKGCVNNSIHKVFLQVFLMINLYIDFNCASQIGFFF